MRSLGPIQTNADILRIIAEYTEQNPVIYTRLAMVNRDFYEAYTSDKLWAKFDCYGVGSDIFLDFIEKARGNERLLVYCWWAERGHRLCDQRATFTFTPPYLLSEQLDADKLENKYARLGFYKRSGAYSTGETGFPVTDRRLFELLLDPERFWQTTPELFADEDLMVKATYNSKIFYQFFDPSLCTKRVAYRLIDQAAEGGAVPSALGLGPLFDMELIKYALSKNPRVVSNWLRDCIFLRISVEWARELGREALLSVVRGVPEALLFFPDMWPDREFCLTVFEYVDGDALSAAPEFLALCHDDEIVAKALENFGCSIYFVHESYVRQRSFADLALEALDRASKEFFIEQPTDAAEWVQWVDWDPASLARIIDQGLMSIESIKSLGTRQEFDDREWVEGRIYLRPRLWNLASARLKQDRELLVLAFEANERLRTNPRISGTPVEPLEMEVFPSRYHHDQEIVERAAEFGAIKSVPYHRLTREMVKAHLAAQRTLFGLDLSGNKFQDLVCEAVLENISLLFSNPAAERLVRDTALWARVTGAPQKHLYLVARRWCLVDGTKRAEIIEEELAQKLMARLPGMFIVRVANPKFPEDGQGAYRAEMLAALRTNGHLFNHLNNDHRYSPEFQQAIGWLR